VKVVAGGDINGPWDLAARSWGHVAEVFVTNVLNGTVAANGAVVDQGTVVRLVLDLSGATPKVIANTIIGSGFAERTDPAALVVGPTGVGLARNGTLYVADTVNSAIRAIPNAPFRRGSDGTGSLVSPASGATNRLNGPLGLAIAPNGDILTVNAGNGRIVETTPAGDQVAAKLLDHTGSPPGSGALFGLALTPDGQGLYFVDDDTNTLDLLH
jgi:DNA-binding beta-propeller fold protein YncE